MKLGYKKIQDDITVGGVNTNYCVGEILDLDVYDDISTIYDWWNSTVLDWGRRRNEIKPLFYAKAGNDLSRFNDLTDEEKIIGCKCFFAPINIRLLFWDDDTDKILWSELLSKTKHSREATIEAMRKIVGEKIRIGELSLLQTQLFSIDVDSLVNSYNMSDDRRFKQWLTNEVGSQYENDGFAQKTYFSVGLRDELVSAYNGNF